MSAAVEESGAEGLHHACSAVVSGASAEPCHDGAAAFAEGVAQQFAEPVCGGAEGIALMLPQEGQSAGRRHVDDGGAVGEDGVGGRDLTHQGVVDEGCLFVSADGAKQ